MKKLLALIFVPGCMGSVDGPVTLPDYAWLENPPCVFTPGSEHVLRLNAKYGTCHLPYLNLELKILNEQEAEVKDCTGEVTVTACTVIMNLECERGKLQGHARMDSYGEIVGDAKIFSTSCRSLYTLEEGQ